MNILPKKSWHVRTRKNIEKVRRDEAQAAEEEKSRLERVALAEREARTRFLRKRARGQDRGQEFNEEPANIFQGIKDGEGDKRVNLEHELEEKKKREQWEEKVGILKYLHKKDADVDQPWYLKSHAERLGSESSKSNSHQDERLREDPLNDMEKLLSRSRGKTDTGTSSNMQKVKKDVREIPSSSSSPSSSSGDKMAKLREERLKREAKERARQQKLLRSSDRRLPTEETTEDDRSRPYHSQFYPQLAKQSRFKPI